MGSQDKESNMLKIYGGDLSAPSNKIRFVANFLGLEYEYKKMSLKDGENRKPEYLALHPAGKIPVIDDGGFVLFESDSIVKYLASKQNSPIYPAELQRRALVDQWIDFVTIHVGGSMSKVLFNRVFYSFAKVEKDDRSLQDGLNFLNRFLPIIEKQLTKSKYLAGMELTLADFDLLANLDPAEVAGVDLGPYQKIAEWRNQLKQRDFYTKCYKEYGESLRQAIKG